MRKGYPDVRHEKRDEIASMINEAQLLPMEKPALDVKEPPALTSLRKTVVWVPYNMRGSLVEGLPASVGNTMLHDIHDPKRHSPTVVILEQALHHDALQKLAMLVSPETLATFDRRLLYRVKFKEGVIAPTVDHDLLPAYAFKHEDFAKYLQYADAEFAINAYLWKRWAEGAK